MGYVSLFLFIYCFFNLSHIITFKVLFFKREKERVRPHVRGVGGGREGETES